MRQYRFTFLSVLFVDFMLSYPLAAQQWDFVKEKDAVKMYIRQEIKTSLKSYRGIADINAPAEKIFDVMEDINNTDWWDKNLTQIKVLKYEKYKRARYYLVYDLPWPVADRDLCVDVTIRIDTVSGERLIDAFAINGVIPERKGMVRITNYRQTWTIIPLGKEKSQVILEGFIDPAGSVPEWISNMLITDSPYRSINGIRKKMEGK